jgi:SAM-dependent methyltransferase
MKGLERFLRPLLTAAGLRSPTPPDAEETVAPTTDAPVAPPVGAPPSLTEEALGQALLWLDGGLGLFRLAHLMDAIRRAPGTRSLLSIGSGLGLQEAYIAVTRPDLAVTGVDLRVPHLTGTLPNLRFLQGDLFDSDVRRQLPVADFVFSIECLEHIENDETVFATMVGCVAPGGRLYVQVPFANASEQADPDLCRNEREQHEHVRPGYDDARLRALARLHELEVEQIASAFRFPLQPFVRSGTETIDGAFLFPRWRAVLELIETDVRDGLAANRTEATAIKMLARRPAPLSG